MKFFLCIFLIAFTLGQDLVAGGAVRTCEINNVTYTEGETVSSDPCMPCVCAPDFPDQQGCVIVVCLVIPDCGTHDTIVDPGQCCPKCPTCDVVGPGYKPGDKLPIGDPCTLECICDSTGRIACTPGLNACLTSPCPNGTKEVTETIPGECCPNITCVPDTSCVVNGTVYPVGSPVPSDNPCMIGCGCVAPGRVDCASVDCPLLECPRGQMIKYLPDRCCPICVPANNTCEINNVTYTEGETVSSDPCLPCICAPDAPNQQSCLIIDCFLTTGCGGHELVIDPGECCPKCPTCDVVGPGYKPGDTLPIGDPCSLQCICDSEGRIACVPGLVACPTLLCQNGTKAVTETIPGECCPNVTCVPDSTCVVNGTVYPVGSPVPSDNPCMVGCFCQSSGRVTCASVDCPFFECKRGQMLKYLPGRCCPICVPEYPNCTFNYCKRKKNSLCTKPDADGDCTCKLTSCKATYFAMDEREAPAKCSRRNRCASLSGDDLESCLKKWGNCVKKEFKKQYGKTPGRRRNKDFFKCLEYPCSG